ncbi:MAG: tetratricopeptide repeat protein [Candidatus Anammoximicrobium sp.]|nr:tetratricopeptide repeat protein [Candidatus Anammoximicrobium sp.]
MARTRGFRDRRTPKEPRLRETPESPWRKRREAKTWAAGLLILLAGAAAYSNSTHGEFVFDDAPAISMNPSIRRLWRLDEVLAPVDKLDYYRPVLNLSLAACYSVGGLEVVPYHLFNLGIHLGAALTLFGLVRRTLRLGPRDHPFGPASTSLALAATLLWMLHPLHTETVTYVVQRCEAMYGLFSLLALYCVMRGASAARPRRWYAGAVAACLLGMGSKEATAVAPFVILLYDRTFLASSLRSVFRQRWGLYVALAFTWGMLVPALLVSRSGHPDAGQAVTVWEYARSQFGVVVHYLRLSVWPAPLCLDYQWPVAQSVWDIVPPAAAIGTLAVLVLWTLWRWPRWGFLGASFFLTLAPSSSVIPILDLAFEHRMYLPLAPLVVAIVLGVYAAGRKLISRRPSLQPAAQWSGVCLVAVLAATLGTLTYLRNDDYRTALRIWQDTVAKAPKNSRAHTNLGAILVERGRADEGIACYRKALEIDPRNARTWANLGIALIRQGRVDEGRDCCQKALELDPRNAGTHYGFGVALVEQGRVEEGVACYRKALEIEPDHADAHSNLGLALVQQGKIDEGIGHFLTALEIAPDQAEVRNNFGHALLQLGRLDEALLQLRTALELAPDYASAHNNLGRVLTLQGRFGEARSHYEAALAGAPNEAQFHHNLSHVLAQMGKVAEAIHHGRRAAELRKETLGERHPDYAASLNNLGLMYQSEGDHARAEQLLRRATEIWKETLGETHPDYAAGLRNLAVIYRALGDRERAATVCRQVLELNPGDAQARYLLELLAP